MAKTTTKAKTVETAETTIGLTFKQKLAIKIEEAQATAHKAKQVALDKLLDNDAFVETQRSINAKEIELRQLTETMEMLNNMKPFVTNDGRKFGVNVFPIAVFGTGLAQVLGIISGSRGAFVDEKLLEYSAITGISTLELQEGQMALGSPAYYKDGKVFDEIKGDYTSLKSVLQGVFIKMDIHEFNETDLTRAKYDLYFAIAEAKANKQLLEHDKLQDLEENSEDFVME